MSASITVPARFNGPPQSGNGGYVAGLVAAHLPPADDTTWPEVSLRAPVPLETPLAVLPDAAAIRVQNGDTLIAEGRMAEGLDRIPAAPAMSDAETGRTRYRCWQDHPLPTCFVCGTDREDGDGLRIFTGPFADRSDFMVAAPWTPVANMADTNGLVRPEILWAALDCPGAFAVDEMGLSGLKLLGRLAVRILDRPSAGHPLIVAGWSLGSEGRKHGAGTAVYTPDGRVLAIGKALWIELRQS